MSMQTGRVFAAAILAACALNLAGCASPDKALFVTSTNVGIGYDATTATGHVGFDRQEAYIGPDYPKSGGIPPVAASLQSELSWFNPVISQYFATGDAALLATGRIANQNPIDRDKPLPKGVSPCSLNLGCSWSTDSDRRIAVVGTNTHVGIVVKTASGTMSALNFGYGRQEASLLSLNRKNPDGAQAEITDLYPSAFASIRVNADDAASQSASSSQASSGAGPSTPASPPVPTGLPVDEFFATGGAADALAVTVPQSFKTIATAKALQAAADAKSDARAAAKSLGIDGPTFDKYFAIGEQGEAADAKKIQVLMNALVGPGRQAGDTLASSDETRIAALIAKVPADTTLTTPEKDALASLPHQTSVGRVQDVLTDYPNVRAALYDQYMKN